MAAAAAAASSGMVNAVAAISPMTSSQLDSTNQEVSGQFHNFHGQHSATDLSDLNFHTNPLNLGVNEFSSKSKTLPKGTGNKKYSIPLRNRDCNSLEGAVGGENNNLRSAQLQDPKSTSKLFEALKENVYTEVTNLITANESRPHFLIQLFRELQLISSDPLRQRTIQSIQELYNRYVESTIILEEDQRINNAAVFLQSPLDTTTNVAQEESFELSPSAQSTPRGNRQPDAGFINLIMNEIISAVHAVDYINDSILQKVTNIVFNHVSANDTNDIPARLMISNDDFLRQLNHWNRTDKDEFITNLENYLNNILVECSNVAQSSSVNSTTTATTSTANTTAAAAVVIATQQTPAANDLSINESSSPSNYNGFAIFMDGELAEADQVCSNDENIEEIGGSGDGMLPPRMVAPEQTFEVANNEVLMEVSL